ncbi:MAG TPA: hypothetical protein VIL63_00670 [Terriglobales bacterium]
MSRLLLHPIARRVRQRPLMVVKPTRFAHVDIAAAERTPAEMLGFAQGRTSDLFTRDGAARRRRHPIYGLKISLRPASVDAA